MLLLPQYCQTTIVSLVSDIIESILLVNALIAETEELTARIINGEKIDDLLKDEEHLIKLINKKANSIQL